MNGGNLPCLVTFIIEFTAISLGSRLSVPFSAAITWCSLKCNTCSLPLTLHKQTFPDCGFIMVSVVSLAMEEI